MSLPLWFVIFMSLIFAMFPIVIAVVQKRKEK